jgi:hypothetical protein
VKEMMKLISLLKKRKGNWAQSQNHCSMFNIRYDSLSKTISSRKNTDDRKSGLPWQDFLQINPVTLF